MNHREDELRSLVCKVSDGTLTNEEADRLNAFLKDDLIAQESYLDHLMIDGLLERECDGASAGFPSPLSGKLPIGPSGALAVACGNCDLSTPLTRTGRRARLFSLIGRGFQNLVPHDRPQFPRWSLAVAFLIAVLATGWFFPFPHLKVQASKSTLALSDAGFESVVPVEISATADAAWYGDKAESVEQFLGLAPLEGRRMLRFVKSSAEPKNACEIYQFVDLRPLAEMTCRFPVVEASAFFNSLQDESDENDYTFGITVFAFSEDPSDESKLWPMRWQKSLTFSGQQLPSDASAQSWQRVTTRLAAPLGTQFLVIQLSVTQTNTDADGQFPGQFVDDVQLSAVGVR